MWTGLYKLPWLLIYSWLSWARTCKTIHQKYRFWCRRLKKETSLKSILKKITVILQIGNIMSFCFWCFQDFFGPNFLQVNATGVNSLQQQPANQFFMNYFLHIQIQCQFQKGSVFHTKPLSIRFHLNSLVNMDFQWKKKYNLS